jgi:hypothetical protein
MVSKSFFLGKWSARVFFFEGNGQQEFFLGKWSARVNIADFFNWKINHKYRA